MPAKVKLIFSAIGTCAVSVPIAFVVTILLFPLWSWVEDTFGIESVGHSGPAGWCFVLTYLIVAATLSTMVVRSLARSLRGLS